MLKPKVATVGVSYETRDGLHIFTCKDVVGVYVAHHDLGTAWNDVGPSIAMALKLNHGIECTVEPAATFEEFLARS